MLTCSEGHGRDSLSDSRALSRDEEISNSSAGHCLIDSSTVVTRSDWPADSLSPCDWLGKKLEQIILQNIATPLEAKPTFRGASLVSWETMRG
ncbi:hypothetical protein EYF80_014050 [Liparis tanakae]|uniref:Uncharacterized protein n=1 Tax=Liparis tanakae TaxID=230148 RepID=A0A4Z2ICR3_9TELE|nr:hypothetical protein EYF80_014050 [Liparis tanakae]